MTRYGPWIQDPDFDTSSSWTHSNADFNARRASMLVANGMASNSQKEAYDMDYFPSWSPVPDANMMEILNSARVSPYLHRNDVKSNPVVRTTRLTREHVAGTFAPGSQDWGDGGSAVINRFPYYVPLGFASAAPLGWIPFYYSPRVWPSGAVDIEFENGDNVAEMLRAWLLGTTQIRADNIDNSAHLGEELIAAPTTTFYAQTVSQFNAPDGPTEVPVDNSMVTLTNYFDFEAKGPTVRPLGSDIELTGTMGPNGCVITTMTDTFIAPQRPDRPTLIEPNNYWDYGFYIDRIDIGWKLRPPRYRWIYDTAPIRRTFPRDDGLAGGAGRTWPPSSSQQSSNRTFGGYL